MRQALKLRALDRWTAVEAPRFAALAAKLERPDHPAEAHLEQALEPDSARKADSAQQPDLAAQPDLTPPLGSALPLEQAAWPAPLPREQMPWPRTAPRAPAQLPEIRGVGYLQTPAGSCSH